MKIFPSVTKELLGIHIFRTNYTYNIKSTYEYINLGIYLAVIKYIFKMSFQL